MWISDYIHENKVKILTGLTVFVASTTVYLLDPVKEYIQEKISELLENEDRVSFKVLYDVKDVCENCDFALIIQIIQESKDTIKPGVININLSENLSFLNLTQQSFKVPEFDGMEQSPPIYIRVNSTQTGHKGWFEIAYKNPSVTISDKFDVSITADIPMVSKERPKVIKTDTNRIELTGTWNLILNGSLGEMSLKQFPDSKISGEYFLSETKGFIKGFKDGHTFRAGFYEKTTENDFKTQIEAIFKINTEDTSYIEIKGCAYGIEKDSTVRKNTEGSSGCTVTKDYVGWRGVTVSEFYASALIQ